MTDTHVFTGKWITDSEFSDLEPRNVFHRQLEPFTLDTSDHRNRHILFRSDFSLEKLPAQALLWFTADDYAKVFINGSLAAMGPACGYPDRYGYLCADITPFLKTGRNVLAAHTLYQGLINRVWVSADQRHGFLCDIVCDGKTVLASGPETFRTHPHTGFTEIGEAGYHTQFLEEYDSASPETGFEQPDFDDSAWLPASLRKHTDYQLIPQETKMLTWETVLPVQTKQTGSKVQIDFGATYVGYLNVSARGKKGDRITIRCAQELNEDGTLRYHLRSNCVYEETWLLSGNPDTLDQFDFKSFRYAELELPAGCEISDVTLTARHYPFSLNARLRPDCQDLTDVWNLCVFSQKYGVQEVIQDCMEREKGFYVGDGCYTALTHLVLTRDDSICRKLIRDAMHSRFITDGTVTCLGCSLMQEIAEYPLMLLSLMLWHYRLTGDLDFLRENLDGALSILDAYRRDYEKEGLIRDLDKWCVVEWPANFRDGYDVDITEGQVCHEPHVALNAYYIEAVRCANKLCACAGRDPYRDETGLVESFIRAFYDPERHVFCDSLSSRHVSYIGNVLPFAFMLCPDAQCEANILDMVQKRGITDVSMFGSFPLLTGIIRRNRMDLVHWMLADPGAWRRMLREGATTTYEGWGRDTKWNTSLFHLTLSDGAVFLSDLDLPALFA